MIKWFVIVFLAFLVAPQIYAQEATRFQKEVDDIQKNDAVYKNNKVILFTGSSTIRMWKTLNTDFKNKPVVNHGFGGSEMSDLLYYADELILRYQPMQIFIYEGDNDINADKTVKQIIATADSLVRKIRLVMADVPIYFISAKPSKARWHLKNNYLGFNRELKSFVSKQSNVYYVDLWKPMLAENGIVMQDIFTEDGLHMNDKGYTIWKNVISQYLK